MQSMPQPFFPAQAEKKVLLGKVPRGSGHGEIQKTQGRGKTAQEGKTVAATLHRRKEL